MRKKIGIIGGVGPQATNFIYSKIIEFSQKKYNARENADYPKIIIESVPVPDFISSKEKLDIAKEMLINATKSLSNAGATRLFIGSNTVHILLDELQKNTNVSFDSMVKLVSKHCVEKGFKKVGILGTPILISSNLYQEELKKEKIDVIIPDPNQLKIIEKIIRVIIAGNKNVDKKDYIKILNDFFDKGAEGIILGCTELPLIMDYVKYGDRIINSDEVLAEKITDYYYA